MPTAKAKMGEGWIWAVGLTIVAVLVVFLLFQQQIGEFVYDFPYPKVIGLSLFLLAGVMFAGIFSLIIESPKEKFATRWIFVFTLSAIGLMFLAWWTGSQTSPPFTILP